MTHLKSMRVHGAGRIARFAAPGAEGLREGRQGQDLEGVLGARPQGGREAQVGKAYRGLAARTASTTCYTAGGQPSSPARSVEEIRNATVQHGERLHRPPAWTPSSSSER